MTVEISASLFDLGPIPEGKEEFATQQIAGRIVDAVANAVGTEPKSGEPSSEDVS